MGEKKQCPYCGRTFDVSFVFRGFDKKIGFYSSCPFCYKKNHDGIYRPVMPRTKPSMTKKERRKARAKAIAEAVAKMKK